MGLVNTMTELKNKEIVYAGGGRNLEEARSPGYIDTDAGRVALISVSSTFATGALASDSKHNICGRPGINPLRFNTDYILDKQKINWLKEIDEELGTAIVTKQRLNWGFISKSDDTYLFLNASFKEGESTTINTTPNKNDLYHNCRWISDAKRNADLVIVSLHAHEGYGNSLHSPEPANFIKIAAHKMIDAGADIIVGHGPHMLRPIEIYNGKPIFYSLGNFFFMCETVERFPAEMYEKYNLEWTSTPADISDQWSMWEDGRRKGFKTETSFWESIIVECDYKKDGSLCSIILHPIILLYEPRSSSGEPRIASAREGKKIIDNLSEISKSYNTNITIHEEKDKDRIVGIVEL